MEEPNEQVPMEPRSSFPKPLFQKMLVIVMLLMAANYFMMKQLDPGNRVKNLDGTIATYDEVRSSIAPTVFIFLPITSLILGFFVSFIPYKKLSYRSKYLPASLVTLFCINALMFLRMTYTFIMAWVV